MNPDPTSLDRLHDLVPPPPVPGWPPAPGWSWLLGLLAIAALFLAARLFLHWQHNRYRREALAEYHKLAAHLSTDRLGALAQMAVLLKRTAVSAYPRTEVAPLTGEDWLAFLHHSAGMKDVSPEPGSLLEMAAYGTVKDPGEGKAREAAAWVERWLKGHRVERGTGC